jgi:hypothetical protein
MVYDDKVYGVFVQMDRVWVSAHSYQFSPKLDPAGVIALDALR